MIRWAGRILVFLGVVHLLLTLTLTVGSHAGAWLGGELWLPEGGIADMDPAMAAFWFTIGSFGLPLAVVGATVVWMDRRGIVPPAFIAWALGGWSLVAAAIFEPAPWILTWIPVVLLLVGAKRTNRAAEPVAAA